MARQTSGNPWACRRRRGPPPWLPLALLAIAQPAGAAILHVPAEYPTLKAAAVAADSGDTVLIAPGTHEGGVYVDGKSLTFASWFHTTGDTSFIAQTVVDSVIGDVCGADTTCRGDAVFEYGRNSGGGVIGLTVANGIKGIRSGSVVDIVHCRVIGNRDGTNYTDGGGGIFRNSLFAHNTDDGVDLNGDVVVRVVDNVIRDNDDDGIEFRLNPYGGPVVTTEIAGNLIAGNGEDGIQFIDYPDTSARVLRVERNVFRDNAKAAVAILDAGPGDQVEDYSGPPMPERVVLLHNTFAGGDHGFVGGANVVALNNIFVGLAGPALRRVGDRSIAAYSLFWDDGAIQEQSVVDLATSLLVDPLVSGDTLRAGSPAIDAGTTFFVWQGDTILNVPPSSYRGSAPDLGAFESTLRGAPPGNRAPGVDAGPNQVITLPHPALLDGSVTDDGLPGPPAALTTTWSLGMGPGLVEFADSGEADTQASFGSPGTYVLWLTADDGERTAADSVVITVQPAVGVLERRIAIGSDDAEEDSLGNVALGSTDLELTEDLGPQTVGLRFANVTLPPRATITSAHVQFQADETQSVPTDLVIHGEAADDAPVFWTGSWHISSRPRTEAMVSWSPPPWLVAGETDEAQRTPDLAPIIQEIVDRPGWASGSAMLLIITGTGHRTAESFEGSPAGAPLLEIAYDASGQVLDASPRGEPGAGAAGGFALHRVRALPGGEALRVEFTLSDRAPARLDVMDVTGRRAAGREVGALGAGRHVVVLGARLGSGVYFVRLSSDGRARTTKAVVLR